MKASLTASLLALCVPYLVGATNYPDLTKDYSGASFFNDWDFYDSYDNLTNGDVVFIGKDQAGPVGSLAYVDPVTQHAILRVDNTTVVPWDEKRNTVRITTKETFPIGSLIVADIYHAPYGCSVWPSFWAWAADKEWPVGGEIDIFEGINTQSLSQMGLHTAPGCTQVNPKELTTKVKTTDCAGENNAGCIVENTEPGSYGVDFARNGGGVFITEFAESGISIWFFPRSKVPASVTPTAKSIDTATLGTPMGNWPSTGCDIPKFFEPQNLVLTITLCGDFAGNAAIFAQSCPGTCYLDYVIKDPKIYDTAYFDIASIKVYNNGTKPAPDNGGDDKDETNGGGSDPGSSSRFEAPLAFAVAAMISLGALATL